MIKKYKSQKYDIIDALDEIDSFMEKMNVFMNNNPEYEYEINITKRVDVNKNHLWDIMLIVRTDGSKRI
jgi:ribosome assembly protein YihI (activator of Der GTPase)